jgi:membrane associated rhomboid family serine protease
MVPLRDNIPSARYPVVTMLLIVTNLLVFLWELSLGRQLHQAVWALGLVPVRYTAPEILFHSSPATLLRPWLSAMFMHGGWLHLISNLWVLWIFGDNVEDRLGRIRFLLFYLASGVAAAGLHVLTHPHSPVPVIGASGAVAGVMGAYFRLFPRARVLTVIPPLIFAPVALPAVIFLGLWFLLQFYNGTLSLATYNRDLTGIAWWAHVGGFGFGLLLGRRFTSRSKRRPARLASA